MNYGYTIKIDLEEKEKEAINILVDAYNQCMMDDHIECEKCPFCFDTDNYSCLPNTASMFVTKKGKLL